MNRKKKVPSSLSIVLSLPNYSLLYNHRQVYPVDMCTRVMNFSLLDNSLHVLAIIKSLLSSNKGVKAEFQRYFQQKNAVSVDSALELLVDGINGSSAD